MRLRASSALTFAATWPDVAAMSGRLCQIWRRVNGWQPGASRRNHITVIPVLTFCANIGLRVLENGLRFIA